MRPEGLCESPVDNEAANSIAPIGKYSLDVRPSHSTTALALLVVMRKTTPRRPVQTDLPLHPLLKAAAARALSFTKSSRVASRHEKAPPGMAGLSLRVLRRSPSGGSLQS